MATARKKKCCRSSNTSSKIITLVKLSLQYNIFSFNNNFYRQTKGSPMGGPLSSPLAEIVLRKIDKTITNFFPTDIIIWQRYIDDIFCIANSTKIDTIFTQLKSIHNDIDFTIETENNKTLPFLDPNSTPDYIHFSSYCPLSHKINTVKTLSKRIYTHCSTQLSKDTETQFLINKLSSSGYPKNFILRHLHNPSLIRNNHVYKSICIFPYSHSSTNIARILSKHGIRTYYESNPSIATIIRNPITRNTVYSIPCNQCNNVYVGETGRHIKDRIDEHRRNIKNKDPKSLIVQHIRNTDHDFNLANPNIHYTNINSKYKRLILEALISSKYNSINRHIDIPETYDRLDFELCVVPYGKYKNIIRAYPHILMPAMTTVFQKIVMCPEQQLYTPKIEDIVTAVIEMHGDI
ncbi:hypothetical protein LAZ67_7002858 [Cordylochernes scorpioides]|uniref:Reverse transcriptase domain-containing protein n=1 Tax=Cordylochernes scorpioides TaxID=51811 RepID=A0ABY6KNG7_9ARAC|nr:hypothetical protein LAZ67_7002858 [Cordylochernes scorpioides]